MTRLPTECVVDASAGVKLFVAEEHSEEVQAVFDQLAADPPATLCVPDLFFIECANILWKKVRRGEHTAEAAAANLADLRAMELQTTPTADLMERALEIACDHGVTAYDACYVALGERLDVPLLSADGRLAAALGSTLFEVLTLTDLFSASCRPAAEDPGNT